MPAGDAPAGIAPFALGDAGTRAGAMKGHGLGLGQGAFGQQYWVTPAPHADMPSVHLTVPAVAQHAFPALHCVGSGHNRSPFTSQ